VALDAAKMGELSQTLRQCAAKMVEASKDYLSTVRSELAQTQSIGGIGITYYDRLQQEWAGAAEGWANLLKTPLADQVDAIAQAVAERDEKTAKNLAPAQ
jgi:uncharacterized protein YukE